MDSMRNDNDYLLFAGEKEIKSIIKDGKNRKNKKIFRSSLVL